jgi:chloramphenicol 3-O phosphotransferase
VDEAGRVVVLNGTSSAGKTTIATAFRDRRAAVGDFWLLLGIDDVLSKLPAEWLDLGLPTGRGRQAADGLWFEATPAGQALRVGRLCRQLLHIYRSTVAAAAHAGLNVIVDDVVLDAQIWHDWQDALTGLDVVWVGVHCDLDVIEARERSRGDRPPGMARSQFATVHAAANYDLSFDTTSSGPEQAVTALMRLLT